MSTLEKALAFVLGAGAVAVVITGATDSSEPTTTTEEPSTPSDNTTPTPKEKPSGKPKKKAKTLPKTDKSKDK